MSDPDIYRRLTALERALQLRADRLYAASGTWTPALDFAGGGSVTYSSRSAEYIRLGDAVLWHFLIGIDTVSAPTGNVTITGFPFTAAQRCGGYAIHVDNIAISAGYTMLTVLVAGGASALQLRELGSSALSQYVQGAAIPTNSTLEFMGMVFV